MAVVGYLRSGDGYYLRGDRSPRIEGYLYAHNATQTDGYLRPYGSPRDTAMVAFPTQYAGLRYYKGAVMELCLVAVADAPAGDQWRVYKGGSAYAVYLVDTTDPNASHVRVAVNGGVKAARLKT